MNQHTRLDTTPIPFIDVAAQRRRLGSAVDDAVARGPHLAPALRHVHLP